MNKIKILSPQEAQKIAAGEVVERPVNIVKETIENSIDAGSTQISLYIEEYGKKLIRIVDNGYGMSKDDAKLCFVPHATSKITKLDDLINISSFGFRGEALASISAVSKTTLKTKLNEKKEKLGTLIEYENCKHQKVETIAMQHGTDLQIKDLFYNTPVRKKFLKQNETEFNLIQNIFQAFCLSNLKIHFKLFKDNKLTLNAPPVKSVKNRASQIWGHNFAENLIGLDHELQNHTLPIVLSTVKGYNKKKISSVKKFNFNISGFITNHNFSRYGRQQMFFFVNNRYIKSTELSKALFKGYLNVLPPAKFPACFIFIELDNEFVDINVHPKKEEVRFVKPKTIENRLQLLVQQTLQNNLNKSLGAGSKRSLNTSYFPRYTAQSVALGMSVLKENNSGQITTIREKTIDDFMSSFNKPFTHSQSSSVLNKHSIQNELNTTAKQKTSATDPPSFDFAPTFARASVGKQDEQNQLSMPSMSAEVLTKTEDSRDTSKGITNKIIGQLFQTYILIEGKDEFIIIDQHAAHERILYEGFLKNFEKKDGTRLMFQEIITLKENHLKHVLQSKVFLSNQGIEIEQFGQNQIAIKSSPPKIQNQNLKEYILDIADFIDENEKLDSEVFRKKLNEHMHSHLACKMAIKAGDILSQEEMQKLINDLQQTEKPLICVHGRPTTWIISKYQLERNFKRK